MRNGQSQWNSMSLQFHSGHKLIIASSDRLWYAQNWMRRRDTKSHSKLYLHSLVPSKKIQQPPSNWISWAIPIQFPELPAGLLRVRIRTLSSPQPLFSFSRTSNLDSFFLPGQWPPQRMGQGPPSLLPPCPSLAPQEPLSLLSPTYQVFGELSNHGKGRELSALTLGMSREGFHRLAAFGVPVPRARLSDWWPRAKEKGGEKGRIWAIKHMAHHPHLSCLGPAFHLLQTPS